MKTKILLTVAAAFGLLLAVVSLPARQAHAQDDTSEVPVTIKDSDPHRFSFSTGSPDGKLGALSRPAGSQGPETETADDFVLTQATVVSGATMHGLIPAGARASSVGRVEVEIYHIFPLDSDAARTPSVPTRMN